MKPFPLFFIITALFAFSCSKHIDPKPGSGGGNETINSRQFQIVLDSLPGKPGVQNYLTALLSVINDRNEPVIVNKTIPIYYSQRYYTNKLVLPAGQYKVSKFILFQADSSVAFAAPIAGSPKAGKVSQPLPVPFAMAFAQNLVSLQVAAVSAGSKAADYGYEPADLGKHGSPADSAMLVHMKILALVKIGQLVYDSIPVSMRIQSKYPSGETKTSTVNLVPGTNNLALSALAVKHTLTVEKWGITDEIDLTPSDLKEGMTLSIGGYRAAKLLTGVFAYQLANGTWKPLTKDDYQYDAQNNLKQVVHHLKRADQSVYIGSTDKMLYAAGKVQTINTYNEENHLSCTTHFWYNERKRVSQIVVQEGNKETVADFHYTILPGSSGITGNYSIDASYHYSWLTYSEQQNWMVNGGNAVQTTKASSHGSLEAGNYAYDFNINPFAHLNLPALYLQNLSKHNVIAQQKTYVAALPEIEPYNFQYTYRADGYPSELITQYRNAHTKIHSHTIKTMFVIQE